MVEYMRDKQLCEYTYNEQTFKMIQPKIIHKQNNQKTEAFDASTSKIYT